MITRCNCNNIVYTDEPSVKIRAKLVFEEDGLTKALCRNCKAVHVLPLDLKKSIISTKVGIFVPKT